MRVLRPLAQANIAPYLLLGCALGVARRGAFEPARLGLALGLGLLVHAVVILTNEHGDWEEDRRHAAPTPFSGGSGVPRSGLLTRRAVGRAALAASAALLLTGPALILAADAGISVLLLAAVLLAWTDSHPPHLARRGLGAFSQALGVGLLLPALGYGLQAGRTTDLPWAALVPALLLGLAGNVTTALPDREADLQSGKATLAVRLGRRPARALALSTTLAAALLAGQLGPHAHPGRLGVARMVAAGLALLAAAAPALVRDRRDLVFVALQSAASLVLLLGWSWALAR